jgi:hypothetical protein
VKIYRVIIWVLFIGIILYNLILIGMLKSQHISGNLFTLPLWPQEEAKQQLTTWSHLYTRTGRTVLEVARINTWIDFLFIISYVSALIFVSYAQMQKQHRVWLNALLRLNFPLAFLIGVLDGLENLTLLHDMAPYVVGQTYCSPFWFTFLKFFFTGWALLILLASLLTPKKRLPGLVQEEPTITSTR